MRSERGIVLLEVLVAVVILATAGIGLVELVGSGLRAEREARLREGTLATEERLLSALTLLNRKELDQRIGRRGASRIRNDLPHRATFSKWRRLRQSIHEQWQH